MIKKWLLVLFIYISSIAHNEKLSPNFNKFIIILPLTFIFSTSKIWVTPYTFFYPFARLLFNTQLYFLSIGLITYLLIVLLAVSHISFFHFGALRENFVNTN